MRTRTSTALLTAGAVVVLSACSDTPTEPQPLDVDDLVAFLDPGNGATITRFTDNSLVLLTQDFASGLFSVHYSGSAFLSAFLGCAVPSFTQGTPATRVELPSAGARIQINGEVYAIVYDLAGFPGNVFACEQPLAEGRIKLNLVVSQGAQGNDVANFASNGLLTDNSNGGQIRLHHRRQFREDGSQAGTVRLR